MTKYWIGVASKNHVMKGVEGGFAMLNHGKLAPLKRMSEGDCLIFYSPKIEFGKDEACQKYVAIGKVKAGEIYQFQMTEDFIPYRRNVEYLECVEAEIKPLIDDLEFIKDKQSWGYSFRFGHLEISKNDFELIVKAMNVKLTSVLDKN
jgi:predicted RNA-binding protein